MQSSLVRNHSVTFNGRKTAVSVEDVFWAELKHMAIDRRTTLSKLVEQIDTERRQRFHQKNLSSAIRLFVLDEVRRRAA